MEVEAFGCGLVPARFPPCFPVLRPFRLLRSPLPRRTLSRPQNPRTCPQDLSPRNGFRSRLGPPPCRSWSGTSCVAQCLTAMRDREDCDRLVSDDMRWMAGAAAQVRVSFGRVGSWSPAWRDGASISDISGKRRVRTRPPQEVCRGWRARCSGSSRESKRPEWATGMVVRVGSVIERSGRTHVFQQWCSRRANASAGVKLLRSSGCAADRWSAGD